MSTTTQPQTADRRSLAPAGLGLFHSPSPHFSTCTNTDTNHPAPIIPANGTASAGDNYQFSVISSQQLDHTTLANTLSTGLIIVTDADAEATSTVPTLTEYFSIPAPEKPTTNINATNPTITAIYEHATAAHAPSQCQLQHSSWPRPTEPALAPSSNNVQYHHHHHRDLQEDGSSNLHQHQQKKDASSAANNTTFPPTPPSTDAPASSDFLTLADVSSSISALSFTPDPNQREIVTPDSSPEINATTIIRPSSSSSSISSRFPRHQRQPDQPQQPLLQPHAQPPQARKTSPGLAARLKALGFGTSKSHASSSHLTSEPNYDRVGRLNEHQLRQLDEKHQAGSFKSVIVRRGRPWKGASATPPSPAASPKLGPSVDLDPEFHTDRLQKTTAAAQPVVALTTISRASARFPPSPKPDSDVSWHPLLPEIRIPEPLAMDTQKYRLPDHTNGNGTKATPELRREHIERESCSEPAAEISSPPPPPPPPKETPPAVTPLAGTGDSSDYVPGLGSYFTPGHNRPGSIYTLSRASFANQLAQLTSLQLPDAESLSSKVSAIRTAQVAAKALINAADQIRSWIAKASEVIAGLDSEDDVEWSAAGGREGLAEVENAIVRFGELISAYVSAIEELQARQDISNVPADDLKRAVSQMEVIVAEWARIRSTLQTVRAQVEIAMEWEELWNNVLGDIQDEMDELSRLVFEMEERRHKSITAGANGESVDIGDLETIVEDTPPPSSRLQLHSRLSIPGLPPMSPGSPSASASASLSQDDSSLLALFARMQPLRASLDFLPMRLSGFQMRAEQSFPTACEELDMRKTGLDATYRKLEKDAESLRKELGEDRWVIVFRGAGRQAQKMHESVERSLSKLKEAIDADLQVSNPPTLTKKIESYEAKKTHYGPAIERVLSIIDKGVKDRLTVNGEILRLHADLETKWSTLKEQTHDMDAIVEELQAGRRGQQLRDSVSSMLSNDRSTLGSGRETPGSSPPSSVIMSSIGLDPYPKGSQQAKTRSSSVHSSSASNRRYSSLPAPAVQGKKSGSSRLSTVPSSAATTPVPASRIQRPSSTTGHRPKWNGSTNTSGIDTGHNFKPLSLTTPSPYSRKTPLTQRSASSLTPGSASGSKLPTFRSPLGRSTSESPRVEETPTRTGHSRLSFRERLAAASPVPKIQQPRLMTQKSTASGPSNRRSSFQPPRAASAMEETRESRPASSLASTSRRSSLLPQPRARRESSTGPGMSGSETSSTSRLPLRKHDTSGSQNRPAWRP